MLYLGKETAMHGSTPTDDFTRHPAGMINIPDQIPVFPLRKVVLLPGEVLPLHIFEPRYRAMVRDALKGHRVIGMIEYAAQHESSTQDPLPVRDVGCVGFIADHKELPDGRSLIWLFGLERFTIDEEVPVDSLYRQFHVTYTPIQESAEALAGLQPVRHELRRFLPRLVHLDEPDRGALEEQLVEISDSQLIALACQILELPSQRKRQLLEADNQTDRFMLLYEDLYRHLDSISDPIIGPSETLN
jgi:Lon protease-like protein